MRVLQKCSLRLSCGCMWFAVTLSDLWKENTHAVLPANKQAGRRRTCHSARPPRLPGVRLTVGRVCWSSAAAHRSDEPPPLLGPPGNPNLPDWPCAAGDSAGPESRCRLCCYLQTQEEEHTVSVPGSYNMRPRELPKEPLNKMSSLKLLFSQVFKSTKLFFPTCLNKMRKLWILIRTQLKCN